MKKFKNMYSIITVILVIIQAFTTSSLCVSAHSYDTINEEKEVNDYEIISNDLACPAANESDDFESVNINPERIEALNNDNSALIVEYNNSNVESYYFEVTENLTLIQMQNQMSFKVSSEDGLGSIDIYAVLNNGQNARDTLYTYTEDGQIYTSDISSDTAWYGTCLIADTANHLIVCRYRIIFGGIKRQMLRMVAVYVL